MYMIKSDEYNKTHNPVYYLYLLVIMAIGWIGLFLIKLRDSFTYGGGTVDRQVISYVEQIRSQGLSKVFIFISKSGDTIVAIIFTILVIIYFYLKEKRREAKFYAVNILGIAIVSQIVKFLLKRPRPVGKWLVHIGGYSFPSGHAILSMAGVLTIIYFILENFQNRILAHLISIILFIYAALVGLSRVYVGVHYISDVVGGWAISSLWVFITLMLFRKSDRKNIKRFIR